MPENDECLDNSPAFSDASLEDEPRNHPFLWVLAILFLFLSVPFYYPEGRTPVLLAGLPDWCWLTLLFDLLFAIVVFILITQHWREAPAASEENDGPNSRA